MKKLTVNVLRTCSRFAAPLALARAVLTMNSTCWLFTCQPTVPKTMTKYIKR